MFLFLRNIRVMRLVSVRYVANTSHRYCVNFIGCRSDDELNSRWPAWYTKCCQAKYLAIWPTIFISPQRVLLAPSGPLRGESALSLVFTVVLVTDVLLQLDHVSGTTLLTCQSAKQGSQLHRIQKTTENIHVSDGLRRIVTFLIIGNLLCLINTLTYLLTYLLTSRRRDGGEVLFLMAFVCLFACVFCSVLLSRRRQLSE